MFSAAEEVIRPDKGARKGPRVFTVGDRVNNKRQARSFASVVFFWGVLLLVQ